MDRDTSILLTYHWRRGSHDSELLYFFLFFSRQRQIQKINYFRERHVLSTVHIFEIIIQMDGSRDTRLDETGSIEIHLSARRRTEETVFLRLSTNDSVMISNCSTRHDEKESYWIHVMSRLVTCRSEFGSVVVQELNRGSRSKLESQYWAHILIETW